MKRISPFIKRPLASLVLLGLLTNALAFTFLPGSAQAEPAGGKTISSEEQQRAILQSANTINEARDTFGLDPKEWKDGTIDFNVNPAKDDSGSEGFQPRSNTVPQFRDLKGNPWMQWSNDEGDAENRQKVGGVPVRFVLTEVMTRESNGIEEKLGNVEGVVYIFRQEYNTDIATILWARDRSGFSTGNDWNRFVFSGSCYGVTRDDSSTRMANLNVKKFDDQGDRFPSDPAGDKFKKVLKDYKLERSICKKNTGVFAKAMDNALNSVKEGIADLFGWIKKALLGVINVGSLSDNAGLLNAWKTIRDFVNLLFILVLIAVAFSNILRLDTEKYGARALLPRLVFAVIAVNFSFLLVQILVNVSYIISQPFLSKAMEMLSNPPANGSLIDPSNGIGQFLITMILVLAVLIGFVVLFVFFVVRILMIWLLAALSPFVFLLMVLPLTRSMASMWWKNTLKWVFMAPISFVILFIAAEFLASNNAREDINGPDFLLKVAFFAGAAFAAVLIPLKLGGEVMGRAAGAAKAAGMFGASKGGKFAVGAGVAAAGGSKNPLKFGRQGEALLEQRQSNQKQEASLAAATASGNVSDRLSGGGAVGRAAAGTLTGGSASTVSAQRAAVVDKFANDIAKNGRIGMAERRQIADGDHAELTRNGHHDAAALARTTEGRQAAGRLLAKEGLLSQSYLDGMSDTHRAEQFAAGNNKFMQDVDPMLAGLNHNQELSDTSQQIVHAAMASADPSNAKHFKYEGMHQSLQTAAPGSDRHRAAVAQVSGIQDAQIDALLDSGSRHYITESSERDAFGQGLRHAITNNLVTDEHGNHDAAHQAALDTALTAQGY